MPLVVALVATALCLPFLIQQRTGLTVSTWIDPTTRLTVAPLAYRIFVNPSMLLVVGCIVVRLVGRARPEYVGRRQYPPFVPLLSLLLFPIVIIFFSLLVQPTIYERYLIVVALPLAVLASG